jgi:hypothetical protein
VLTVDSSGNVTANASLNAKAGVGGGTYASGVSASGFGYCVLGFTNGAAPGPGYRRSPARYEISMST